MKRCLNIAQSLNYNDLVSILWKKAGKACLQVSSELLQMRNCVKRYRVKLRDWMLLLDKYCLEMIFF